MYAEAPYQRFTLFYCRADEFAVARVVAFPDAAAASEHARLRILRMGPDWISAVVAEGVDVELEFVGAWNVDAEGALTWEDASIA